MLKSPEEPRSTYELKKLMETRNILRKFDDFFRIKALYCANLSRKLIIAQVLVKLLWSSSPTAAPSLKNQWYYMISQRSMIYFHGDSPLYRDQFADVLRGLNQINVSKTNKDSFVYHQGPVLLYECA